MNNPAAKIPGGYTKAWRKELSSEIWLMPPLYHRVWYWLRMNVQHEVFLFPTRGRTGIWVLPGQRITSLQQIAEGVRWTEWGRDVTPNKKSIKDVLDWLESREMVTVESNAKGTLVTIVNWHTYNGIGLEQVTGKGNSEVTRSGHKEEGEEGEEVKTTIPFSVILDYLNAKAGKRFRVTDTHKRYIRARWSEGHVLEDFKTVIDNKVNAWGGNPEMVEYLRPVTLFGTKFDSYLQTSRKLEAAPPAETCSPVTPAQSEGIRKAHARFGNYGS